jgi:2-polyprenyl-3-methyl-5-hydroxy-6-metoxy-1,4-benzoquinol methylase
VTSRAAVVHHRQVHPFDTKAAEWDSPVHVERAVAVAAAIRASVPLAPSTRVVDVGAGTGLLGRALAPHAGSVVITDPSPGMLAEAATAIARDGLSNMATRRFELGADVPPAAEFDLAVSLMAMHHVQDTDLALRHLAKMLAPGGWIAVADLDAEDGSFHVDPDERAVVLHGYDRDDLRERAESAGFEAVGFEDVWDISKNDRRYTLFLMTARLAG